MRKCYRALWYLRELFSPGGCEWGFGFASGTFTTLGVEDFSLNATSIYPNPSNGSFSIETKTRLDKINVYKWE